ncbi:MAG TPA: hypothetical protein EYH04_01105, partial [Archaeoglobus profundus]|nr:hypothetical protein [Archaeoglobus profundus]
QILTKEGLKRIADAVIKLAEVEGFKYHAVSVKKRLEK